MGVDEYPPVWLMMMKLRNIMGKREAIYELSREVEIDEALLSNSDSEEARGEAIKRGAGTSNKQKSSWSLKARLSMPSLWSTCQ